MKTNRIMTAILSGLSLLMLAGCVSSPEKTEDTEQYAIPEEVIAKLESAVNDESDSEILKAITGICVQTAASNNNHLVLKSTRILSESEDVKENQVLFTHEDSFYDCLVMFNPDGSLSAIDSNQTVAGQTVWAEYEVKNGQLNILSSGLKDPTVKKEPEPKPEELLYNSLQNAVSGGNWNWFKKAADLLEFRLDHNEDGNIVLSCTPKDPEEWKKRMNEITAPKKDAGYFMGHSVISPTLDPDGCLNRIEYGNSETGDAAEKIILIKSASEEEMEWVMAITGDSTEWKREHEGIIGPSSLIETD